VEKNVYEVGITMTRLNDQAWKRSTKESSERALSLKLLRTVSTKEAFHFYTDIGQYYGQPATSLADFCEKLEIVPTKSIDFHFTRGDFEKWIRESIGDKYLANEIAKVDESLRGEELRKLIRGTVKNRLLGLKKE
jgi:Family of unknown function (DUF5752)